MIYLLIVFLLGVIFYLSTRRQSDDDKTKAIGILVRQTARWSLASEQDKSPLITLLHANYGAGYLSALSNLFSKEEIEKATNIDYPLLKSKVLKAQDTATKQMTGICPVSIGPVDPFLAKIAGDA
jgi:hypothetical protein